MDFILYLYCIFKVKKQFKMMYPIPINIFKTDYFEYITNNAPKKIDKFFEKIDDADEEPVFGYLIKLPNLHPAYYDELWLLDINDETGFAPILIQNINGSSPHAAWSCDFERDDDQEVWDLKKLIEYVGDGWKKGLQKVMEKEYKKEEEEEEEIYIFAKK